MIFISKKYILKKKLILSKAKWQLKVDYLSPKSFDEFHSTKKSAYFCAFYIKKKLRYNCYFSVMEKKLLLFFEEKCLFTSHCFDNSFTDRLRVRRFVDAVKKKGLGLFLSTVVAS